MPIGIVMPEAHRDTAIHEDLGGLERAYLVTCALFEDGELSVDQARDRITALSARDRYGRRWRIDTKRSGKAPRYVYELNGVEFQGSANRFDQPLLPRETPAPSPSSTPAPIAAIYEDRVQFGTRNRLNVGWLAFTIVVVLTAFVGGAWLTRWSVDALASWGADDTTLMAPVSTPVPVATTSTSPPTTTTTTLPPALALGQDWRSRDEAPYDQDLVFGASVLGEPLTVHRRGDPWGVRVLVVGSIHGDEPAGHDVVDILREMDLPDHVDLWLVRTMNPDGVAAGTRQNARAVDMNRNFPTGWEPLGEWGDWQYSGPRGGSEPEVQAMTALGSVIEPHLVIWYHQDYFRIAPSRGRNGEIRARYAELVDLPLLPISGGSYSGTGGQWARTVLDDNGLTMTVEFGPALREGEAQANAEAVFTIVDEFFVDALP